MILNYIWSGTIIGFPPGISLQCYLDSKHIQAGEIELKY